MLETPQPASRQDLTDRYRAAVKRGDWRTMVTVTHELAIRDEYDIAAEVRLAQGALDRATTRLEAAHTDLSVAQQALADGRERAPLAIEQAPIVSNDSRVMTRATITAYWRDALPKLEQSVSAAEGRCQENAQRVSEAQERRDRLLTAAYARVQQGADNATDKRGQP